MKTTILLCCLFLVQLATKAQTSMTFKLAEQTGIAPKLDSLYVGGIDSDSTRAVFKDQKKYIESYQNFIYQLASFLSKNNFKWGKQVRCFNRIYFSKQGTVDYFLYNFTEGQITKEQEADFEKLVKTFVQEAKFGLQADRPFAQCSPVKYTDL
jgi:hypothetical protein